MTLIRFLPYTLAMKHAEKQSYAVIMGDLVGSQQAPSTQKLHVDFNQVIANANEAFQSALSSPLTITLGDEFQALTKTLVEAATIARSLRWDLLNKDINCRFVVGLTDLQTPLNSHQAWNMMGPGLAEARHKLNDKQADLYYRFSLSHKALTKTFQALPLIETLLDALGAGLSTLEAEWTAQQRQDIIAQMRGDSASDLAERRSVTRKNIYKVRSAGHYDTYSTQWTALLSALEAVDDGSL